MTAIPRGLARRSKLPKGQMMLIQRKPRSRQDLEDEEFRVDWEQVGPNCSDLDEANRRLDNTLKTMRSRIGYKYRIIKVKVMEVLRETD